MGGVPTKEELAQWMTPRQALNYVQQYFSDFGLVPTAIMGRIHGGAVRTAALHGDKVGDGPVLIERDLWSHLAMGNKPDWWDTGDIRVYRPGNQYRSTFEAWYFGVRFDPAGVEGIVAGRAKVVKPVATTAAPKTETGAAKTTSKALLSAAAPSRAGRPRKDFWDDLIIATCRAVWLGDLKPKTQAEIERWMLQWASDNTEAGLSETAVKAPAKKVFDAFQD